MVFVGLLVQGREERVPLKEIAVQAYLQGSLVGFRSKLVYENNTENPFEVLFRTPLDDSYAVVDLEAIIDGEKIRAELQEREKAKKMYEEAITSGHTAAFGEEVKGDIFRIALGNLPAGKKAEIHLTIVGELGVDPDGSVRFVLPTVLKPRYTPTGDSDPLEAVSSRDEKPVKHAGGPLAYKFDLIITGASDIAEVTSPSHSIRQETSGNMINVGVFEDSPKDIVILVHPKEPHKLRLLVEPGLSDGANDFQKSTAIMLSFFPEFKGDSTCAQAACEFVFLVDRSGSMQGTYIQDAAQTLLLFLKSIPEGCYFNIVGFGSSYEKLFPESVKYNQKNMEIAVEHVKGLQADLGGTEIFDPLKDIFSHSQMKGLPRQVFVLTDGSVSNTESVIKLVSKNSHKARCFSFGIGSGASSSLVKGIANAGKGAAEFITSGERMQPKVIRSLRKAMQPAVTGATVKFNLPDDFTIKVAPETVPPIFIGESTIVFGILDQSLTKKAVPFIEGTVCLSGDLLGAKIKHEVKLEIPTGGVAKVDQHVATIHHLAGKRLIKEMESMENKESQKEAIINLSLESNVISSFTAFVAIDKDKKAVKGSMQIWDIQSGVLPQAMFCCSAQPRLRYGASLQGDSNNIRLKSKTRSKKSSLAVHSFSPPVPLHVSATDETIINLQLASGAWDMTSKLAAIIGKKMKVIKDGCPVPCKGIMETVWATVIALTYLEHKQADLKDEWELVAVKAQTWLAKQNLVENCSIESLCKSAVNVVC